MRQGSVRLGGALAGMGSLLLGSCACLASAARAQVNPGALNPGLQQRQQQLQQQQQQLPGVERGQPKPLLEEKPEAAPVAPADPELLINRVQIQGARVIAAARLEAPFAPLLGHTIRFSQLQQAIDEASNIYRREGYFISRVVLPEGGLTDGVLSLLAVEGYIEKVEVIGRGSPALKRWTAGFMAPVVSTAANPRPVRFARLERQLLAMQSVGGMRFSSTMAKGTGFASSQLIIDLDPRLVSGSVGINNNVLLDLGDYQVNAQLQANVLDLGQPLQIDLGGSNAFPYAGGSVSGNGAITTPLGNSGLKLALSGGITGTTSTSLVPQLGVDLNTSGVSNLGSLALRYPIVLSRRSSVQVSLQGDVQNISNDLYFDGTRVQSSDSRLRVLRLGLDASHSTPFASSYAGLQLSQGLPIWDAQVLSPDPALSNPYGSDSFVSARLTLQHQQRIGASQHFFTVRGMGQWAGTPLPSSEDFSYGGPFLGRAYRSTFLIADQGVAGGLEYSFNLYSGQSSFTPFVFYDVASVDQASGSAPLPHQSAGSYGIGLRGSVGTSFNYELGWAIPTAISLGNGLSGRDGPSNSIVYFRAALGF